MSDAGIRVNMSSKEGKSASLEPLPSGRYLMAITDIDLDECGPTSKNEGEPMFKIELTVQEGDYENRKAWTNVMLFKGALYSISQMLKAQGIAITEVGESAEFQVPGYEPNIIPGPEWWMSKQFCVRVKLVGKRKVKQPDGSYKEYDERAEVKGFMAPSDFKPGEGPKKASTNSAVGSVSGGMPSILP